MVCENAIEHSPREAECTGSRNLNLALQLRIVRGWWVQSGGLMQEEGHQPLIFSQWTSVLDILEWLLDRLGLPFLRLDGSTAVADRLALVDQCAPPPLRFLCCHVCLECSVWLCAVRRPSREA